MALTCLRTRYPVSIPHRLRYVLGMSLIRSRGLSTAMLVMNAIYLSAALAFLAWFFLGHTTSVEVERPPALLTMVYSRTESPPASTSFMIFAQPVAAL